MPPPRFVNPALFLALLRPVLMVALWGPRRRILRQGGFYRPYLDMRLEFDTTQADALLAPAGIEPPRVMEYLERLFAYCVESDWGRRRRAGGGAMIRRLSLVRNREPHAGKASRRTAAVKGDRLVSRELESRDSGRRFVERLRFSELHREVAAMGRFLVEEAGLRRGDRVAIFKSQ